MPDPDAQRDTIDLSRRQRFEAAWIEGHPEPIERSLPPGDDDAYLATLEELVGVELRFVFDSWHKAHGGSAGVLDQTIDAPPRLETYLDRFAPLRDPEIVGRLVQKEWEARSRCGETPSIEEYRRRFPEATTAGQPPGDGLPMVSGMNIDTPVPETLPGGNALGGTANDTSVDAPEEFKPRRFGNYELLEEIGRGGMGIVYRARQLSADRIVALKLIQRDRLAGLSHHTQANTLGRFRHEARAAAKLEHEHIVTVYEVGEIDGQPFFSMRYVEGRDLAQMLRDGPIANRRAAGYMEPVARAVHEAHSLGILHRDLKPQNIPVDSKTGHALVADFGLAKLSEGQEELTKAGEVMGTPSYMSPEQALDSASVTALTDVYGLGATLYHILTGRPPFQAATPVETLRQVIDELPAAPRQVNPSIDRDLETVCLKCLEKDPARRYLSAAALADDLKRYLAGEPIVARPISLFERTYRWCRRNPGIASLAASTVTLLIVALVATFVGFVTTRSALQDTESARKQAEKSFQQAQGAVDDFLTTVSEDTLLNEPGMQPLRRKLLTKALDYYRQFLIERGDDPTIRDELAEAQFRVGVMTEEIDSPEKAIVPLRRARDMQQQLVAESPNDPDRLKALANTLNAIGGALHRQGKAEEALKAHREAAKVRRRLVETAPKEPESRRMLANSFMNIGTIELENQNFEEAKLQLESAQNFRRELLQQGHDDPEIRRDVGKGHFTLATLAMQLGEATVALDHLDGAIEVFGKLLDQEPRKLANQKYLVLCYRTKADLLAYTKANLTPEARTEAIELALYQDALYLYHNAVQLMEKLARTNPDVPEYQAELAGLYIVLGQFQDEQRQPDLALESYGQARDILETLAAEHPNVPVYCRDLAATLCQIAILQKDAAEVQAARDNLSKAREHLRHLLKKYPETEDFQRLLQQVDDNLDELDTADQP
ncbi:MAG: protein kinase [Candidatus Nealsonbacteria bacterium]|nr:protein kinase [Candidatus Nealsonbacteria bacterium]